MESRDLIDNKYVKGTTYRHPAITEDFFSNFTHDTMEEVDLSGNGTLCMQWGIMR